MTNVEFSKGAIITLEAYFIHLPSAAGRKTGLHRDTRKTELGKPETATSFPPSRGGPADEGCGPAGLIRCACRSETGRYTSVSRFFRRGRLETGRASAESEGAGTLSVRIRMSRHGRTHRPFFRIAAVDKRRPRDGRVIEELGYVDPIAKDESKQVSLEADRIRYWLSVGAQPSDTVRALLKKHGVLS